MILLFNTPTIRGLEWKLTITTHPFQPAAEIIAFRMGELRGLSRWRARYQGIGLDETLISNATEKAGMILVQVERFIRVVSSVVQQVSFDLESLLYSLLLSSFPVYFSFHFPKLYLTIESVVRNVK